MGPITLDAEAGQVSAELARHGIDAHARVRVLVQMAEGHETLPMAAIAQGGRALEWLAEEPELYSDDDLLALSPGLER